MCPCVSVSVNKEESIIKTNNEEMKLNRNEMIALVINSKYSINDQIALLRQKDTKPEEWEAFNAFAEEIKAKVTLEYISDIDEKVIYDTAKRYYTNGLWTDENLISLVENGYLTVKERKSIIESK